MTMRALLICAAAAGLTCGDPATTPGTRPPAPVSCPFLLESLGPTARSLQPYESSTLEVALTNACHGPASNAGVSFGFDGPDLGVDLLDARTLTDHFGRAEVTVRAGSSPGRVVVVVYHSPGLRVRFDVEVTTGACAGHCDNGIDDCGEAGVDCGGGVCTACPSTSPPPPTTPSPPPPPPPPPPPAGQCDDPQPPWQHSRSKIKMHCSGTWCDATPSCHGCDFCAEIGMPCMPGPGPCIPRCDCPPRPEGHPQRIDCETVFFGGDPWWRSDGTTIVKSNNRSLARCEGCTYIEVCRADGTLCKRVEL